MTLVLSRDAEPLSTTRDRRVTVSPMTDMTIGEDDFAALLSLQDRDTSIDQLLHQREHLPAVQTLEAVQSDAAVLRPLLENVASRHDTLTRRQTQLENEVTSIEQRVAAINARLYGASVVAPKDAQAMSEEIKHLEQRRVSLEDEELSVMEQLEPLEEERRKLEGNAHELATTMRAAQQELVSAQNAIDERIAALKQEREVLTHDVAGSLLAEYERLRASIGGVVAAPVVGTTCGGCHLALSASELDRIRKAPASDVLHCEECGRILVR